MNEKEMKETIAKINKTKSWFCEKINKIGKPLTRLIKKKRGKTQINRIRNEKGGASLAAQWLRICLPMQGTRVRALVWEDPTCRGATRPMSHSY